MPVSSLQAYEKCINVARTRNYTATALPDSWEKVIDPLEQVRNVFLGDNRFQMIPEDALTGMSILDPVMHIAAEVLYCSVFDHFTYGRPFRPLTVASPVPIQRSFNGSFLVIPVPFPLTIIHISSEQKPSNPFFQVPLNSTQRILPWSAMAL